MGVETDGSCIPIQSLSFMKQIVHGFRFNLNSTPPRIQVKAAFFCLSRIVTSQVRIPKSGLLTSLRSFQVHVVLAGPDPHSAVLLAIWGCGAPNPLYSLAPYLIHDSH